MRDRTTQSAGEPNYRGNRTPEALAGLYPTLDGPVILFDQVEVTADAEPAGFGQSPFIFQLRDSGRVSAVTVGVDHARLGVVLPVLVQNSILGPIW